VACLEKPYAKHVLEVVSRMVDEAAQQLRAADLGERYAKCGDPREAHPHHECGMFIPPIR